MGFADSPATRSVLASHGIRVSGYRWRWAPGLKGGTFPPHRHVNGQVRTYAEDFPAEPGEDVNGSACMCALVPAYRTPDGRMAKPGLAPVFQAPVTASWTRDSLLDRIRVIEQNLDLVQDVKAVVAAATPQSFQVTIPDGAIVINLPEQGPPVVHVAAPEVTVAAPNVEVAAPSVTVEAPTVNVEPPTVNVEAPVVTVEPSIELPKPAPPKMLPAPKPRETRIIRDETTGAVIGMKEVT